MCTVISAYKVFLKVIDGTPRYLNKEKVNTQVVPSATA